MLSMEFISSKEKTIFGFPLASYQYAVKLNWEDFPLVVLGYAYMNLGLLIA